MKLFFWFQLVKKERHRHCLTSPGVPPTTKTTSLSFRPFHPPSQEGGLNKHLCALSIGKQSRRFPRHFPSTTWSAGSASLLGPSVRDARRLSVTLHLKRITPCRFFFFFLLQSGQVLEGGERGRYVRYTHGTDEPRFPESPRFFL